jgi:F-type H+-transporting ATPase subunit delta
VRQTIRGYADGVVDRAQGGGGADLPVLAAELAAVRDMIGGSDDLRRVLSDPGVPVASRRAVLDDLLASRVSGTTMALVGFVLGADRAPETVADLAWMAARFDAAAGGLEPAGDTLLGHKAAEERVEGYAAAVLGAVDGDHELGEVEDELFRFQRVVAGSAQLREALTSRDVPAEARQRLVTDLLASKASPATSALAAYATRVGRPRDYQDLLQTLVARIAAEANRRLAEVRSAVELDDEQRRHLAAALSRAVGHRVEVRVTVDPSVVAGFVATIGDTVVDGSARHQLELLKDRLVMPEATITTGERH